MGCYIPLAAASDCFMECLMSRDVLKRLGRGESATPSLGPALWRQDAALCGSECPLVSEGCDSLVVVVFAQTIAPLYTFSFP